MTAPARKDAVREAATDARLSVLDLPKGGFTAAARAAALARVRADGLPGKRDEYWRYTDPSALNAPQAPQADRFDPHGPHLFSARDRLQLTFVDGVFDPSQSDDPVLAGVEIARLAEADRADIHWAQGLYGVLEARGQSPVARPFAALNTAAATKFPSFTASATFCGTGPLLPMHVVQP